MITESKACQGFDFSFILWLLINRVPVFFYFSFLMFIKLHMLIFILSLIVNTIFSRFLCQVHVRVRGFLWCAAQRCACLPTPQLPGLLGRGGLREGWPRGPLHLEQRPLSSLGTQHG